MRTTLKPEQVVPTAVPGQITTGTGTSVWPGKGNKRKKSFALCSEYGKNSPTTVVVASKLVNKQQKQQQQLSPITEKTTRINETYDHYVSSNSEYCCSNNFSENLLNSNEIKCNNDSTNDMYESYSFKTEWLVWKTTLFFR